MRRQKEHREVELEKELEKETESQGRLGLRAGSLSEEGEVLEGAGEAGEVRRGQARREKEHEDGRRP